MACRLQSYSYRTKTFRNSSKFTRPWFVDSALAKLFVRSVTNFCRVDSFSNRADIYILYIVFDHLHLRFKCSKIFKKQKKKLTICTRATATKQNVNFNDNIVKKITQISNNSNFTGACFSVGNLNSNGSQIRIKVLQMLLKHTCTLCEFSMIYEMFNLILQLKSSEFDQRERQRGREQR